MLIILDDKHTDSLKFCLYLYSYTGYIITRIRHTVTDLTMIFSIALKAISEIQRERELILKCYFTSEGEVIFIINIEFSYEYKNS